jgi:hypothetical protein
VRIFIDGGTSPRSRHAVVVSAFVPDPEMVAAFLEDARQRLLADPFRSQLGAVRELARRPFSYVDDHETVRGDVLQALADSSFRVNVCVFPKAGQHDWRYRSLFKLWIQIVYGRLEPGTEVVFGTRIASEGRTVEDDIRRLRESPRTRRERWAAAPPTRVAREGEPCLTVPDYVAGVLRDLYDALTEAPEERSGAADPMRRYSAIARHVARVSDEVRGIDYRPGAFTADIERLWYRA